jgi:YggT family protein
LILQNSAAAAQIDHLLILSDFITMACPALPCRYQCLAGHHHRASAAAASTLAQRHRSLPLGRSSHRIAASVQEQQQQQCGVDTTTSSSSSSKPVAAAAVSLATALLALAPAAHAATAATQPLALLAELDAAGAHTIESFLRPLFAGFTVLYVIRITMTWYPGIDGTKLPWALVYVPTEPILRATRAVIPLVGGVDVTPIVWVGLISFFNEILLGPQGILMLIQRQSGQGLL